MTTTPAWPHLIDGLGLWREVLRPPRDGAPRPALFLDRDGVIVDETGYLHEPNEVSLISGAAETIAACNSAGVPLFVVTNQSGVGRGYYGWDDFAAVQRKIVALLKERNAFLDCVLACAYHGAAQGAFAVADHPWRKPGPGMLLAAAEVWPVDLTRSWIVGDHASDMAAGIAAGLAGGVHVLTGHGQEERAAAGALGGDGFAVHFADSVADRDAFAEPLELPRA